MVAQPIYSHISLFAECPTCHRHSEFFYLGEQKVSLDIAAAIHLPESMGIWQCSHCGTGLLEPNLKFKYEHAYCRATAAD